MNSVFAAAFAETLLHETAWHSLSSMGIANVRSYMVWVRASRFIMAGESYEPNAITVTLVEKNRAGAAFQIIEQSKQKFGEIEWVDADQCDPVIMSLLPEAHEELNEEQKQECEKLFGEGGQFEFKPTLH